MFADTENPCIFIESCDEAILDNVANLMDVYGIRKATVFDADESACKMWSEDDRFFFVFQPDMQETVKDCPNAIIEYEDVPYPLSEIKGHYLFHNVPIDTLSVIDNAIWHLDFSLNEWDRFDDELTRLIDAYGGRNLMLNNNIQTISSINEHPCRIGLCKGNSCHNKHSDLPHIISLDKDGFLHPYGLDSDKYVIGNVSDPFCLSKYESSRNHTEFLKLNESLFFKLRFKCTYKYIPWQDMLVALDARTCQYDDHQCLQHAL